ncbi:MAG: efflux transporter outer membrane subunit [Chlorobi bacterium]|nr:efflux transporter outer membrane subunit [Chlorobiota bacterium]
MQPTGKKGFSSLRTSGVFMLFIMALAACSTTAPYRRAEVNLPPAYRGAGESSARQQETGEIPYRSFFSDPELVSLIDTAMVRNHDLQIALKNIDYAHESLKQARLGFLPSLSLGASGTLNRPSDNSLSASSLQQAPGKSYSEDYTLSLGTSWEIDIWSRIRSKKKGALAGYLKTVEAAKAVRTKLVSDVASGYYNLRMLDAQLDIARKNLALADTTLGMIRLQYNAGQVTMLAVGQQEAVLQAVMQTVPQIEQNIAVQEHALGILMGSYPGAVARGRSLASIPVADNLPVGIPAALLQNRPDVRQAEMAVMEAHADMAAAKAAMYPSLTITAQGGLNSFRSSTWFNTPGSLFGLVQGAILQPIFQRGELKSGYEKSRIRSDQAEIAFKQSLLNAVGEVSDALVRLDKLREQERAASARVVTLQKAVANSNLLFRSGMATYIEVISVQSGSLQAELALADIRRQHLTAMAELYRSLGGGWR